MASQKTLKVFAANGHYHSLKVIAVRRMLWSFLRSKRSPPHFSSSYYSLFAKRINRCHHVLVTTTATEDLLFAMLNQCSEANRLYQTHGFMIPRGLDQDNLFLSRFIHACSSLGFLDYAYSAFARRMSQQPDIFLYNAMIKALSSHDQPNEAIFLYHRARLTGLRLDSYSFPSVLKAVVRLSKSEAFVQLGRMVHCQALSVGLDVDVYVAVALIQMYSSCGGESISDAQKVFDEMPYRDVASWNAMVSAYVKVGYLDCARDMFEQMPDKNVISWTCVIAGYAQVNRPRDAIIMFRRMLLHGVRPDEVAMLAALSACAHVGAFDLGLWIHDYIEKHGLRKTVPLNNALIDMYAKSGNINKGMEVFENMNHRSVVTWTTIISGLAFHGFGREALDVFSRMEKTQIRPNHVTLLGVLSACSHVGLVETGQKYFSSMCSRYRIKPKIEHYGCMIDLLGRAGFLQEAQQLVKEMPFEANAAIWGSLLAASKTHGDVELGGSALQHLIEVEPHNSGNYLLLSNSYATLGRWNEAGMTRKVMRDSGVTKIPGWSFIQVNDMVHEFYAGDRLHPQSDAIYKVLSLIIGQLKMTRDIFPASTVLGKDMSFFLLRIFDHISRPFHNGY